MHFRLKITDLYSCMFWIAWDTFYDLVFAFSTYLLFVIIIQFHTKCVSSLPLTNVTWQNSNKSRVSIILSVQKKSECDLNFHLIEFLFSFSLVSCIQYITLLNILVAYKLQILHCTWYRATIENWLPIVKRKFLHDYVLLYTFLYVPKMFDLEKASFQHLYIRQDFQLNIVEQM